MIGELGVYFYCKTHIYFKLHRLFDPAVPSLGICPAVYVYVKNDVCVRMFPAAVSAERLEAVPPRPALRGEAAVLSSAEGEWSYLPA